MAQVIGAQIGLTTYTAGTDPRPGRAEHNAERTLLEDNVVIGGQGTEAARPTSGKGKALYWNTERVTLQWDTGTGWSDISTNGGGGAGRAVLVASTAAEGTSDRSARADHTHSLALATTTAHGAMSSTDKAKLDNSVSTATASQLVLRDSAGRAQVASPSASADIATKGYVDSVVGGAAAPVVTADNNGLATPAMLAATQRVDAADSAASLSTMMVRDSAGRAQVETPAASADIAPKSYVDSQISAHRHDGAHITTGTIAAARLPLVTSSAHGAMLNTDKSKLDGATAAANASTLVMRTAEGTIAVGAPTAGAHATHKTYVDNQVATRAPSSHTHDATQINTGTMSADRLPLASSTATGVINSTTYDLIQGHYHDAAAINSGTFAAARLPLATTSVAGAMSSADKTKLNGATSSSTTWSLVSRDGNARIQVGYPSSYYDAAVKGYVDNKTWDGSAITSGYIPYAHVWGSQHAYNTAWNGSSSNPVRDVYVTSGGELCYTSSTQRHKTNETPWTPDPRNLLAVEVLEYNRIDPATGDVADNREVGVFAEQAGTHVPEFVERGPDKVGDTEHRVQGWTYSRWTSAHQVLHQWTAKRDDQQDREIARILAHLGLEPLASEG